MVLYWQTAARYERPGRMRRPNPRRSCPRADDRISRGTGAALYNRGLVTLDHCRACAVLRGVQLSATATSASAYGRPLCAAKNTFHPSSPSASEIRSISPAVAARPRLRTSPSRVSFTPDNRDSSRRLTPESICCSESSRAISASSRAVVSAFPISRRACQTVSEPSRSATTSS